MRDASDELRRPSLTRRVGISAIFRPAVKPLLEVPQPACLVVAEVFTKTVMTVARDGWTQVQRSAAGPTDRPGDEELALALLRCLLGALLLRRLLGFLRCHVNGSSVEGVLLSVRCSLRDADDGASGWLQVTRVAHAPASC